MTTMTFHPYPVFVRPLGWLAAAALMLAVLAVTARASDQAGSAAIGGEGSFPISGFVVSDIHYALDSQQPDRFSSVSITVLAPDGRTPATHVAVSVRTGDPASPCFTSDGLRWSCPLSLPVQSADVLHVTASG